MQPTYLFYDTETSGLNKCFDQILQFAAIRTDLNLSELERYHFWIKLNPDTVPTPRAVLTHQISLNQLATQGLCEYEAIKSIHELFNTPLTISVGYNNLGFDDEMLRFAFYRNLLPPYTHQYANGCGRLDLYPMTLLYYLFQPEILTWPQIDNQPTFKLEHLSRTNQLISSTAQAHDAITDVKATLMLAQRLQSKTAMWSYICDYFNKTIDNNRINNLNIALQIDDISYPVAILNDGRLGAKNNYQTLVLGLGRSNHYKNQTLWLPLDNTKLVQLRTEPTNNKAKSEVKIELIPGLTIADNENYKKMITTNTNIYRKKMGEPPLLLPANENGQKRFLRHITQERQNLVAANLIWLKNHPQILHAITTHYREYKYPEIPNLDLDASLYANDFPNHDEQRWRVVFHHATISEKIALVEKIPLGRLRVQALRLLGRNYTSHLPLALYQEFLDDLAGSNYADLNQATCDYRGEKRQTRQQTLIEIAELKKEILQKEQLRSKENLRDNSNNESWNLLEELEGYCSDLRA